MFSLQNLRILSLSAENEALFVPPEPLDFSWQLGSDIPDTCQTSYLIRLLYHTEEGAIVLYDSGVVLSDASVHVPCPLANVPSRASMTLELTVTDNHGQTSTIARPFFTALRPSDWEGSWIEESFPRPNWAPTFFRSFSCFPSMLRRATLYVCGLGAAQYRLNGALISPDLLDPLSSNYELEAFYRAYDILPLLQTENTFSALLGDGWYGQNVAWSSAQPRYGNPCLIAQIELEGLGGYRMVLSTNASDGLWRTCPSPVTYNNLYAGETFDARLNARSLPSTPAVSANVPEYLQLRLAMMPAVRIRRTLAPRTVRRAAGVRDGTWIYDFGENLAAIPELRLPPSPAGSRVVLRFAEALLPDGSLDTRSCGAFATHTLQQDTYITSGHPNGEVWHPLFTYHGFRYVEISGANPFCLGENGDYQPEWLRALALSTDLSSAGDFHCDHADIMRLHHVVRETLLSNYHGHPEDCPVRERCGWLGDAQIVAQTAISNFDMEAAYTKYLSDIATSRALRGHWTNIAPGRRDCTGSQAYPLWGAAQVLLPYFLYRYYGNTAVVHAYWPLLEGWVAAQAALAEQHEGVILEGLGDWCPPGGNQNPRRIPVAHSSTLMLRELALRMQELAHDFRPEREPHYRALAERVRTAFNRHFWNAGAHSYGTWASDAAALLQGMEPDGETDALRRALVQRIRDDDCAMPTGIYGNKVLVEALCRGGAQELVLEILFNRRHTSFATLLDHDAASLWECFEPWVTDVPPDQIVHSYNHPMHAGFEFYLFEFVAGIRPLEPGYKTFVVEPIPFREIPSFSARRSTPYGEIRVAFREGTLSLTVPANTHCHLRLSEEPEKVLPSGDYEVPWGRM